MSLSTRMRSSQHEVGEGSGGAGAVRESGGAFGKRGKALEDQYFRNKSAEQLDQLRQHHLDEIQHLEKQIKEEEESLKIHQEKLKLLKDIEPTEGQK